MSFGGRFKLSLSCRSYKRRDQGDTVSPETDLVSWGNWFELFQSSGDFIEFSDMFYLDIDFLLKSKNVVY